MDDPIFDLLERLRPQRLGLQTGPYLLECITETPWHETEEDIEEGLEWGREKEVLLKWIRRRMARRLSKIERRSIRLYYLEGMNYREAAKVMGVNASSVYRATRRGIRKLREAAEKEDLRPFQ